MIYPRPSKKRGLSYQVKRLEGKLNATFYCREAAELQDALWARWGRGLEAIILADEKPSMPTSVIKGLLDPAAAEPSPVLLAQLVLRDGAVATTSDAPRFGEYIESFYEMWVEGTIPGSEGTAPLDKAVKSMRDDLDRLVLKTLFVRDERGWRVKDDDGDYLVEDAVWAQDSLAWETIDRLKPKDFRALDKEIREAGHSLESWRKVLNFLQRAFDQALVEELVTINPIRYIKKPPQKKAKARTAFLPDTVEAIRADFLYLFELAKKPRKKFEKVEGALEGVPVPEDPALASWSADFVEALAYSSCRPGELLAATDDWIDGRYLCVTARSVDGETIDGTKSSAFPVKKVYLLGPLPESLARRAEAAKKTDSGLLFPFPGTDRQMTEEEYRRWRSKYYAPIAKLHGLDKKSDDPYSLRHVYGSLRAAAGHSASYIEQSMGTSLVSKVYTTVFPSHEEKPLDIDKTIRRARQSALKGLTRRIDEIDGRIAA